MECGSQVRNADKNQGDDGSNCMHIRQPTTKHATRRATAADANVKMNCV